MASYASPAGVMSMGATHPGSTNYYGYAMNAHCGSYLLCKPMQTVRLRTVYAFVMIGSFEILY